MPKVIIQIEAKDDYFMIGKGMKEMDNKARKENCGHVVASSEWKVKYGLYPVIEQQAP